MREIKKYDLNDRYKASFNLALNETGVSERQIKKIMNEIKSDPDSITGLGLNVGETKALCAIQKLLEETNYQGHALTREKQGQLGIFRCPILFISITKYLEAYELEKNSNNKYNSRQREEAIKNLQSLENKRTIFFEKGYFQRGKRKKEGEWISNIIEIKAQLIALEKLYSLPKKLASTTTEAEKINRYRYFKIMCSPLLFYQINENYILKPKGLFKAIEETANKSNKKASKSIYNLILCLLQNDIKKLQLFRSTLIDKLELQYLEKQRHQTRINETIEESLRIAYELGFLLSYDYDPSSEKYLLNPNPEFCSRLERKVSKVTQSEQPIDLTELIDEQQEWQLLNSFLF